MTHQRTRLHARVSKTFKAAVQIETSRRKRVGTWGQRLGEYTEALLLALPDDLEKTEALMLAANRAINAPQETHLRVDVCDEALERAERIATALTMRGIFGTVSKRDVTITALFAGLSMEDEAYVPYRTVWDASGIATATTEVEQQALLEQVVMQANGRDHDRVDRFGHKGTRARTGAGQASKPLLSSGTTLDDIDRILDDLGADPLEDLD